jgi:hypothetical protein
MVKVATTAPGAPVTKVSHKSKSERQTARTEKFKSQTQDVKDARKIALKINRVFKRHTLNEAVAFSENWISSNLKAQIWYKENLTRLMENCKNSTKKCVVKKENWAVTEAKKDNRTKK